MAKCKYCNVQAQWAITHQDNKITYFMRLGNTFRGKGFVKVCEIHYQNITQHEIAISEIDPNAEVSIRG